MHKVPKTIFDQLGGNEFITMTGAKYFIKSNEGLMFSMPPELTNNKYNRVNIYIRRDDTYDVSFSKWKDGKLKSGKTFRNTRVEQLRHVFIKETGIELPLSNG